ncbi:MAG: PHB depolymerase family esterase [Acidobacteriota bacterium]
MRRHYLVTFLAIVVMLLVSSQSAYGGTWVSDSVSNQSGSRNYKLWVPSGYNGSTSVPLIMMLHGCAQNPDDFAAGTQMNAIAETNNFLVLYPEEPTSANSSRCWNWFEPAHQSRGSGEPSILAAMVMKIRASYNVDPNRVYVAGLSAGAAMAVVLGATYPDIFAAVGVHSGLEYKAATGLNNAFTAQSQGGPDPQQQGLAAFQAMGDSKRKVRVIVFHGTSDSLVNKINGNQVLTQWAQTNDYVDDSADNNSIDDSADITSNGTVTNGYNFTKTTYYDESGNLLLEKWVVQNLGHAWSGGSTAGSFTDPKGPSASQEIWRFFSGINNGPPPPPPPPPPNDNTAPVLTINPTSGTYDATVTVTLSLNEAGTIYYTTDGSDPLTSSSRKSFTNNGQLTFTSTTVLNAYGKDLADNTSAVQSYNYVINQPQATTTFVSTGSQDGYAASTVSNGTTGNYAVGVDVYVGENADAPFRGVLSFDTTSIPDNATILSAQIKLYYSQAPLGNPWMSLGFLIGDIKTGCLGSSCSVASSDFEADVSLSQAVVFNAPTQSGGIGTMINGSLTQDALSFINKTGRTQFKLRFQNNSNKNGLSDYLVFAGGEYFNSQLRPVLIVQYK